MTLAVTLKYGAPYTWTEVPFEKSVAAIEAMLKKHECERIGKVWGEGNQVSLIFQKHGKNFFIEFPLTYLESRAGQAKHLEMRISGRIIHDRIKALLIDAEIGYLTFAQAMVPYLALQGTDGRPVALQDRVEEIQSVAEFFLPSPTPLREALPQGVKRR